MPKGKIEQYDPDRGCGTIIDFDTHQKLTVYANFIKLKAGESLSENQEVEYEIENNRNVNWAINVRIS